MIVGMSKFITSMKDAVTIGGRGAVLGTPPIHSAKLLTRPDRNSWGTFGNHDEEAFALCSA